LKSLTALHQAHADEPALRNHWAFRAVFFIVRRATEEPGRCLGLLDTLATLHGAHADEPILREHWAQGIMGFVLDGAQKYCLPLLESLAALHQAHGNEPALRERWAQGVMGFTFRSGMAQHEPVVGRSVETADREVPIAAVIDRTIGGLAERQLVGGKLASMITWWVASNDHGVVDPANMTERPYDGSL